jgi:signal transduction histidine kinase
MRAGAHPLLALRVAGEQDVFLARQRGRDVAALVGLEHQDQVRVATAISELSRELCTLPEPATITLGLAARPAAFVVLASWSGPVHGATSEGTVAALDGMVAAARLSDACTVVQRSDGGSVELVKHLPPETEPWTEERIAQLRDACRQTRPSTTLAALRSQNQDLLAALEDLRERQEALLRANAELEETNRGVLALHAELSDELEQTNRGVVALYAELDEATTRLREASESKTRFWTSVSHELRTPLNSVLGLSRLLLDTGSEPLSADQRYQIELIRDSGATLLSLVNELLDVARAEAGQTEVRPRATDLAVVLDNLRASLQPMVDEAKVELHVEVRPPRSAVWIDPELLSRVLRNLVGNALKFTEVGEVRCTAQADPERGMLRVVVSDTGIGIPAEHQAHVFEEFYQVHSALQERHNGTGLGLAYARRLTTLMGGTIQLESEPGQGTTFTVLLPLPRPAGPALHVEDVLVVDDDPAFRLLARRHLDPHTAGVREATDGGSALAALRAQRPDLVLLDLDIPEPHGADVLAEMRRQAGLARVPVVIVTAAELTEEQRAALSATAVVLHKTDVSAESIVRAAEAAIRLSGGRR